ncbi:hypothetical protein A8H39_10860 [Paraburkholderia fungorum]|jgi:hypothetical protein|uniref:hypothetical protein n=1 Tax=Paraburkholderia fungorum TaxID=134537 RepID=UPI0006984842|nr:hypothetical protein [Paraburkholderia fungorum]MBB5543339.1 transcriptional regulator with XRE-family HTH domain [Paraburkholderia fungorum]PNE56303.1 hypothetical protein A8H39_10860 [Paraburkholderia fungorum]
MMPVKDLAGRRFGRLEVIERDGSDGFGKATWKCICDCGNTAVIVGYNLRGGSTLSCGCLVGLVANTRLSALYDGLTLAQHAERSGLSSSTLDKRVRKYGVPFPTHLDKTRAEQELRVFEQDRANNRRTVTKRLGRAAAWHTKDSRMAAPEPIGTLLPGTDKQCAQFTKQDASQATAQHDAERIEPEAAPRERHVKIALLPPRRTRGF